MEASLLDATLGDTDPTSLDVEALAFGATADTILDIHIRMVSHPRPDLQVQLLKEYDILLIVPKQMRPGFRITLHAPHPQ